MMAKALYVVIDAVGVTAKIGRGDGVREGREGGRKEHTILHR